MSERMSMHGPAAAMSAPRPFRFGAEMMEAFPTLSWADSARRLESLGYSTLFVPDHFHQGFGPISAMTAAAQATTSLKVASMVLNTDLRHPAVLARELASIDVLSEGRLEVGLGAGYNPLDYRRSGIPMDPPGVRVDRLIEHAKILRALWATGPTTFHGEHYRITELDGTPKPFRPGGPPLLIAGGGRRMLRFAAGFADIVGVNVALPAAPDATSARDALPDAIDAKIALLRADAGSRLDAVELNAWLSVCRVTTDARSVGEQIAHRFGAPASEVLDSPFVLAGPTEEMIDRLCQRRTRWGYSYVVVPGPSVEAFAPVVAALTGR